MLMEQIEKDELTLDESAKEDNGSLCQELRETIDKFDAMEKTCYEKWVKLEKSRRRCINTAKFTALITAMAATIAFHREMGQVGWNMVQWLASILRYHPQELCGLVVFLVAAWLLLTVAKWTFVAAIEDLFGGEDDDLFDR